MPKVATITLGDIVAAVPRPVLPRVDRRRRRVSQIVGRHADRSRPFIVSVHRGREPLQPYEDTVLLRREWRHRYLGRDDTVLITYLPQGGTAGKIGIAIAAVALTLVAGPIGTALGTALELSAFAVTAIQAGITIGAAALLSIASRSKASKDHTDTRPVYGVTGGGNLPRPGDRIPRLYGRGWTQPDLAQPDFSFYAGEDQVLYKRMVVSAGKVSVKSIRAGQQTVWTLEDGYQAPFTADNCAFEVLIGQPSTLIPGNVVDVGAVGGAELPRPGDNPGWAGPFTINRAGPLINQIAVSYQFPQGISGSFKKSGVQVSNQPGLWGLEYQYAPIDASGTVTGAWQTLWAPSSANAGLVQSSRPIRQTAQLGVATGRYAVRGRNILVDNSTNPVRQDVNTVTWDGLVGFSPDAVVRTGVTEITMKITSEKALSSAAFGQIDVEAEAILPVWTGATWVEQETRKAVWAYCDILRNGDYGGGLADSRVDIATPAYYAGALSQFDTFDGVIRGPVSVFQAAATVLLPMRAEPSYLGRIWSLVRDEPKDVAAHVITRRQIVKGSTRLGWDFDAASGAGHVVGEFDRDGDFRTPDHTPDVIYGQASITPTRVKWQGVSDYDHAMHLTRWRASSGFYRRRKGTVTTEHDARLYARGDGILIDAWFTAGAKAGAVIGRASDTLTLDADITVASGDSLILRDRRGREWGPVALAGQGASLRQVVLSTTSRVAAESASGQTLGSTLAADDAEDTVALVGPLTQLTRRFVVRSVRPSGRDRNEVEALVDDPRVWDALGVTVPGRPPVASGLTDPTIVQVPAITAHTAQGSSSRIVQWSMTPARGADLYRVQISYDGGNSWPTLAEAVPDLAGTAELMPTQAISLDIRAQARAAASGLWGTWTYGSFLVGAAPILGFNPGVVVADLDATLGALITGNGPGSIGEAKAAADATLAKVSDLGTNLRLAISPDPKDRAKAVGISTSIRADIDLLTESVSFALDRMESLRDQVYEAGIEKGPGGAYRIAGVQQVDGRITAVSAALDALKGTVTLLSTTIFSGTVNGAPIVDAINAIQVQLDSVKGTVTDTASRADLAAATAQITSAQQQISALGSIIQSTVAGQLAGTVDLLTSSQADLFDLLTRLSGSVDQSFATAMQVISSRIDANGQRISESSKTLVAVQGQSAAQYDELQRAIASGDSAIALRTSGLEAAIGDAKGSSTTLSARLLSQDQARVDGDGALGQRVSSVEATLTDAKGSSATLTARLVGQDQARVDGDSALGQRVSGVEATLTDAKGSSATLTARLVGQDQARVDGDSALGQRVSGVEATLTDAKGSSATLTARLVGQDQARVDGDGALGQRLTGVEATLTDAKGSSPSVAARIGTEEQTRASQTGALAQRTAALETTVNTPSYGVTARVALLEQAVVTPVDGLVSRTASLETSYAAAQGGSPTLAARIADIQAAAIDAASGRSSATIALSAEAQAGQASASGRFAVNSYVDQGGARSVVAMQVSHDPGGAKADAGLSLIQYSDGSTQIVADVDRFTFGGAKVFEIVDGVVRLRSALVAPNAITGFNLSGLQKGAYLGSGVGDISGNIPGSVINFTLSNPETMISLRVQNVGFHISGSANNSSYTEFFSSLNISGPGFGSGNPIKTLSNGSYTVSDQDLATLDTTQDFILGPGSYSVAIGYHYVGHGIGSRVYVNNGQIGFVATALRIS